MPVRVKVDENLPDDVTEAFQAHRIDAVTVRDQNWEGLPDRELWQRVAAEGSWLVTADKEFGDLRRHPPGTHPGIILRRLAEESREDYAQLAEMVLRRVDLDEIAGAVIVVNQRGVRIRGA